jgi:hypothetical protein
MVAVQALVKRCADTWRMWRIYCSRKRKEVLKVIGSKRRNSIPDIDYLILLISLIDQHHAKEVWFYG